MKDNNSLNGIKMIPCPECRARVRIHASYCYNCGSELNDVEILDMPFNFPESMQLYCPFCGKCNDFQETFHCIECWESGICMDHMSHVPFVCSTCHRAKIQASLTGAMKEVINAKMDNIYSGKSSFDDYESPPDNMVLIPEGIFVMGDECREVHVPSFYIDIFPVTNKEFKELFTGFTYPEDEADCPVVRVTYYDAMAYAQWKGKRLPTEAEWEKAARGTDGRIYPWGNEFRSDKCNWIGAGIGALTPVSKYENGYSPYGCFDMAGNCVEWVSDWYDESKNYISMKSSCFLDYDFICRCANRTGFEPPHRFGLIGFRCAV